MFTAHRVNYLKTFFAAIFTIVVYEEIQYLNLVE